MKIKGSQLKVGHVLAAEAYAPRSVVTAIHQDVIKTYPLGPMPVPPPWPAGPQPAQLATDAFTFELDDSLFTPAQLHADALLDLVRAVAEGIPLPGGHKFAAQRLMDSIDPPQPVALDEALAALHLVTEMRDTPGLCRQWANAADVLLRARKSGQLK